MTFSEEVVVSSGALTLHNMVTGEDLILSEASLDTAGNMWDLSGGWLTDRHYKATLRASLVADVAGNALDGDSDALPGGDCMFAFSILLGDTNGDLIIDDADLESMTNQFGMSGVVLTADFNGDGRVDLADFGILRSRHGESLSPRPALPGDADANDTVDADDLLIFQNTFGHRGPDLAADFNGDGAADLEDFAILRSAFGSVLPWPAPVPCNW